MIDSTSKIKTRSDKFNVFRLLIFPIFLLCVNLLAGYVAINLHYASLYNVSASFWEYAIPFPLSWGFAHLPSMFIYGVPLIFLPKLDTIYTKYFRIACICTFLLLLLEFDKKIPFLLFPKVDSLTAFVFSLVVAPPNSKDNPALVGTLKLIAFLSVLALSFFAYSTWKHKTPVISKNHFHSGVFELKSILVKNDFHKSMVFEVDLKEFLPQNQTCVSAQTLASEILLNYPFDNSYNKIITVTYNPVVKQSNFKPYDLGEISLNKEDGRFPCYLKYMDNR